MSDYYAQEQPDVPVTPDTHWEFHRSEAGKWFLKYRLTQIRIEAIEEACFASIRRNNPGVGKVYVKKAAKPLLKEHDEYVQLVADRKWMMEVAQLNATMALLYKE